MGSTLYLVCQSSKLDKSYFVISVYGKRSDASSCVKSLKETDKGEGVTNSYFIYEKSLH